MLVIERETYVATYTILYTYKVLIVVRKHFSYVAFVNFFDFSVCRIHVTLDNFTIWCTAIVSAPKMVRLDKAFHWDKPGCCDCVFIEQYNKYIHLFGNCVFFVLKIHSADWLKAQ